MKKLLSVILAAAIVCCLAFPAFASGTRNGTGMSIMGFSSTNVVNGETVTSDIIDDVVVTVINEWANWCGPCVSEMPYFQEAHEYYSSTPDADVQIMGSGYCSSSGMTASSMQQFVQQHGYTYINVVEDNVLAQVFNTEDYIPQTIIVDRHGVVREHIVRSFSSTAELREYIDGWYNTLLAEEGPVGPGPEVPGDANNDGSVNMTDALLVLRYAMGLVDTLTNEAAADVNGDGSINATDALLILRASMGLIELG